MGLSEQTRYVLVNDLKGLVEKDVELSPEKLRRVTLHLDQYRRELVLSIQRHSNEESYLAKLLAERAAAVALWRARLHLARDRCRDELVSPAQERLSKEEGLHDGMRERHSHLTRTIADLKVSAEKVERTLRLIRRKHRRKNASGLSETEQANLTQSGLIPAVPAELHGTRDHIEAAFRALELEEVAGRFAPVENENDPAT